VSANQPWLILSQHQVAPALDSITVNESPARALATTALYVEADARIFMPPVMYAVSTSREAHSLAFTARGPTAVNSIAQNKNTQGKRFINICPA